MGKKEDFVFDIENEKTRRLVLRSLVASGNSQISGIYNSGNLKLERQHLAFDLKKIFDVLGCCFFRKDLESGYMAANYFQNNWQDRLSSQDLFSLFMFQSLVINKMSNIDAGKMTKDNVCDIIDSTSLGKNVVPNKIKFEEKIVLPKKNSLERNFLNDNENKKDVLTKMLLERTTDIYDEKEILTIKNYIEKSFCFGEGFSGDVAKSFFNQKTSKEENVLDQKNNEDLIICGINFSKQVGFDEYGGAIYENEYGNGLVTSSGEEYNGVILNEEPDEKEDYVEEENLNIKRTESAQKDDNKTSDSKETNNENQFKNDEGEQLELPI